MTVFLSTPLPSASWKDTALCYEHERPGLGAAFVAEIERCAAAIACTLPSALQAARHAVGLRRTTRAHRAFTPRRPSRARAGTSWFLANLAATPEPDEEIHVLLDNLYTPKQGCWRPSSTSIRK